MKRIIYDFGCNNGDNIPYYIQKCDLVIAVEANPTLCEKIRSEYSNEIKRGRLIVENFVITSSGSAEKVFFYIHKEWDPFSQFLPPLKPEEFDKVLLPSASAADLVKKHGDPYYIKIDIEHCDEIILRDLFDNNIRPPYISAEAHNAEVLASLISIGRYNAFKIVDGRSVPLLYRNATIQTNNGMRKFSFPIDSAGPFGDDIDGGWMSANEFLLVMGVEGLGWKDIHATNLPESELVKARPSLKAICVLFFKYHFTVIVPRLLWRPIWSLRNRLKRIIVWINSPTNS